MFLSCVAVLGLVAPVLSLNLHLREGNRNYNSQLSCTPENQDTWQTGSHVPCCSGLDENLIYINGDYRYICQRQPEPPSGDSCLCVFDVDRTLTGLQDDTKSCPNNKLYPGVYDAAYNGGNLALSELGQNIASTFCKSCWLGVVSAGSVSGPSSAERSVLLEQLDAGQRLNGGFSDRCPSPVNSPLVLQCPDGRKQDTVKDIVNWYQAQGHSIPSSQVYMFDDRVSNIEGFKGSGFNAVQISCGSRLGDIGHCGAELSEVQPQTGVHLC